MIRPLRAASLFIVAAMMAMQSSAWGANIWLSLNLQFNVPGNVNSGGTWTTVAKADGQGIAGVSMYLKDTTFGSFVAPAQLDVRFNSGNTTLRNLLVGDDLTAPYPLGIGVIGSSFPSTYVDPAGIAPIGGNPNFGTFTGGVALATGTFAAGVLPTWTNLGSIDGNLFSGPSPAPVIIPNMLLTVRAVVPEPATIGLGGMALVALIAASRRKSS
jgi:hypothetical protein